MAALNGAEAGGSAAVVAFSDFIYTAPERDVEANQNAAEVFAGLERLPSGAVGKEMEKIGSGSKRHKL